MLKTSIVGCGKIADSHAAQIEQIKGCEIVGVCDREPLMARQLYERFPVRQYFSDLGELLAKAKPEVVHITTPPESHFSIAKTCLESGCHVYVEKPFTLNAREARLLVKLADERNCKVTVGHDDQFTPVARRLRSLIRSGYLGGPPVHMESHFCYELGATYGRAVFEDSQHWLRRLPGKLLHNIISHGIARIAEFLPGESPEVIARAFISPQLRDIGETEIFDELRVMIADANGATAYFTFSSQIQPSIHQFSIYGVKNGLFLDQDHETLLKLRGVRFKSYLETFLPPVLFAKQHLANLALNVRAFLGRELQPKAGMRCLIESFYRSITEGAAIPIPYREILLTATIMDRIFAQLRASENDKYPVNESCIAGSVGQDTRS